MPVEELPLTDEFPYPILHESGDMLQEGGETITRDAKLAMTLASIEHVYLVEPHDDVYLAQRSLRAARVLVSALTPTDVPDDPLLAVELRLPRELRPVRFDEATKRALKARNIKALLIRKAPEELRRWQVETFRRLLASQRLEAARRELERTDRHPPLPIPPLPPDPTD